MVVHEDVRVEHEGREVQVVRQLGEEPLPVVVAPEDHRPFVAAARNMINGVGKIHARWARHGGRIP